MKKSTISLTTSLLLVAISSPSIHCEEKPLLGRESHPIPFPSNRSWYVLLVAVPPKLSPERGTNRQGASSSMRWCGWRGNGRRTAVRVHTRTRLIAYATESFLLLARHLVLACRSFPLLALLLLLLLLLMITMILVSKNKRFQLWMLLIPLRWS